MQPLQQSKRVQVSDSNARFTSVFETFYRPVWAYCARRLPRAQVDDAVAEVFAVAWRRIDHLPPDDGSLPWLYAVAFRVVSQQRRSAKRRRSLATRLRGLGNASVSDPGPQVVAHLEYRTVRAAAGLLSNQDQEVLRLSLWEELSHAEAARVLGISTDAVKQRLHRAKVRLARQYERLEQKRLPPEHMEGGER